jgi:hypothetical protein
MPSVANIADEDDVPLSAQLLDRDGLYSPLNRAMQLDLDVSDVLEVEPTVVLQSTPITVGRELDEPETLAALEAWVARSFTGLDPTEERSKSPVQPSQSGLGAGEVGFSKVGVALSGLLELAGLLSVGDRPLFGLVDLPAFSEGRVVQAAVGLKHRIESFGLRAVGVEPAFEGLPHPNDCTDRSGCSQRQQRRYAGIPPAAKAADPLPEISMDCRTFTVVPVVDPLAPRIEHPGFSPKLNRGRRA